jgi:hypothetical protein
MTNQYFNALNEFLGSGTKDAKVWFFGIEDGGKGWENTDETRDKINKDYARKEVCELTKDGIEECSWPIENNKKKKGTSIYYYMSYIMSQLDPYQGKEGREYWSVLGSRILHANIFPLAKKRSAYKLPCQYRDLFGLDSLNLEGYWQFKPIQTRMCMLKEKWLTRRQKGPLVTICFGVNSSHLTTIRGVFGLDINEEKVVRLRREAKIFCYPSAQLFITPFFGQCGRANGGALKKSELDKMIYAVKNYFENPSMPLCFGE